MVQRNRIGELLGRIRDLEAEWTQEGVERITTENTALKERVRQLLKAARSNLRFQDRRIADLEARRPTLQPLPRPRRAWPRDRQGWKQFGGPTRASAAWLTEQDC